MPEPGRVLGILAGGGPLPGQVARAALAAGRGVFIVGLEGFAEPAVLAPYAHQTLRLGAAGQILAALRQASVRDLVLVGPVRRPSVFDLRPDAEGVKIMARVGRAAFGGDDGLLAAVVRVLAEEGFNVMGAHEILTESLAPRGLLTQAGPDAQAQADITRGIEVVRALGSVDVGQHRPGPGGVLVKLVKPGQDRRADLPTIGPATIAACLASGLRGIAFEAGGTMLTDRVATIEAADAAGMFLSGVEITP
jgi:DUF1009 family protein